MVYFVVSDLGLGSTNVPNKTKVFWGGMGEGGGVGGVGTHSKSSS